jgi:peptidylprolyl isomerase
VSTHEVVGTGAAPQKGKPVKVHYSGWLTDGTAFDSSRDRGDPITIRFDSGQVIKGWDIGLGTMRVGGKRRLIIPAELGYGDHGAGDVIPPGSVLVFDVELIEAE